MQSITWLEVRTMEEPRSYCSKVRMKSGLLLALGWTLMIAGWAWWPRGHLAGSLEVGHIQVGMDELDMAPHILEVSLLCPSSFSPEHRIQMTQKQIQGPFMMPV